MSRRSVTTEQQEWTAAEVEHMLVGAHALLTGWVLRVPQQEADDLFEPLFHLVDTLTGKGGVPVRKT